MTKLHNMNFHKWVKIIMFYIVMENFHGSKSNSQPHSHFLGVWISQGWMDNPDNMLFVA